METGEIGKLFFFSVQASYAEYLVFLDVFLSDGLLPCCFTNLCALVCTTATFTSAFYDL